VTCDILHMVSPTSRSVAVGSPRRLVQTYHAGTGFSLQQIAFADPPAAERGDSPLSLLNTAVYSDSRRVRRSSESNSHWPPAAIPTMILTCHEQSLGGEPAPTIAVIARNEASGTRTELQKTCRIIVIEGGPTANATSVRERI
jgi:hypothetical protein